MAIIGGTLFSDTAICVVLYFHVSWEQHIGNASPSLKEVVCAYLCICAKRWKVPCFPRMQLCLIAYSFAEDCPLFLPVTTRVFPGVASQHFF